MENEKHDPDKSKALIIRYLKKNPGKNEVLKEVFGEKSAVKELKQAQKSETEPHKYGYLWQWENPEAAHEYTLEQLDKKNK